MRDDLLEMRGEGGERGGEGRGRDKQALKHGGRGGREVEGGEAARKAAFLSSGGLRVRRGWGPN